MTVVTERVPRLLSQIPVLGVAEALTFLYRSLQGARELYRAFGAFSVTDSMVGVDSLGRVKMWFNSNFALNTK